MAGDSYVPNIESIGFPRATPLRISMQWRRDPTKAKRAVGIHVLPKLDEEEKQAAFIARVQSLVPGYLIGTPKNAYVDQ